MKLKIAFATALIATIMIPSAFAETVSVEIDNSTYDIDYSSNNVVLKSVTADLDFISLLFETKVSNSSGDVSITFERDFFDAKIGIIDDDFFILSDGDEIEFEETKNDQSRTLSFSLSAGTEEIEIIGTILAGNSFLIDQKQQAKDNEAAKEAEAKAKAEAEAEAEAKSKAEAEAKSKAEEKKLEKLKNACGEGTVFEGGECVLSPLEKNESEVRGGPLIYSIVIGMSLGIVIMLILWGIGKKSHKVLSDDSWLNDFWSIGIVIILSSIRNCNEFP